MSPADMLVPALQLAVRGVPVFPCNPRTKSPLTPHGFKDATADLVAVRRLFAPHAGAMIGIPTGAVSGLFVVDLDVRPSAGVDGEAALERLIEAHEALPITPHQRTPSGGMHILFRMPAGRTIKSSAGKIAPGIDVRGDGGYICVAPSVRADGNAYRWIKPLFDTPLADAPQWLLDLIPEGASSASPEATGDVAPGFDGGGDTLAIDSVETAPAWFQRVAGALRAIDNSKLGYDEWIAITHAVAAATDRDEVFYQLVYEPWALTYPQNTPEAARSKWDSMNAARTGWRCLTDYARAAGWQDPQIGELFPDDLPAEAAESQMLAKRNKAPIIKLHAGSLDLIAAKAERALVAADDGIYQFGTLLVRPAQAEIIAADGGKALGTRLVQLKLAYLRERLMFAARFESFDKRSKQWYAANCPPDLAQTILEHGTWRFPVLAGFTNCPVLRPDGTILTAPGYDAATGLLYAAENGRSFPAISETPDRAEALAALGVLKSLVATMPYLGAVDRAVALSAILSAIARRAVPLLPMHAFSATGPGQGKSMHADIVAEIAEGRRAAAIPPGAAAGELEKQLVSALIKGDAIISLDNLIEPLGKSAVINACLSQERLDLRVLGKSLNIEVPGNRLLLSNGNNLILESDVTRRTILGQLDARMERPELREFDHSPIDLIRADRGRYVAAALTVLRAFHVAGRPQQTTPLGGFEPWSRLVRDALIWLGEADPVESMNAIRAADPELAALGRVVVAWAERFGEKPIPAKRLIECEDVARTLDGADDELREALEAAVPCRGPLTARAIGDWLRQARNRVVAGFRIVSSEDRHNKASLWRLQPV